MKKLLSCLCLITLICSLAACTGPSGTQGSSSANPTDPIETAETTPPETTALEPSSSDPETEAPTQETSPVRNISVNYFGTAKDLSEEKRAVLEDYLEAHIELPEEKSRISVKNLIAETEDYFLVYLLHPTSAMYGRIVTRYHLIKAEKRSDAWTIENDLTTEDIYPWPRETEDLFRDALQILREKKPLSAQEIEDACSAAIQWNMSSVASKLSSAEKTEYEARLQAFYDPDWENEWLPRCFDYVNWTLNDPLLLIYVMDPDVKDGVALTKIASLYRPDTCGWSFVLKGGSGWSAERPQKVKEPDPPKSTWNLDDPRKTASLYHFDEFMGNAQSLTDEQAGIVLGFADLLINEPDPAGRSGISEEVRANWNYWYGSAGGVFVSDILWSDEDLFVVKFILSRKLDDGYRAHLVRFVRKNGQWIADKDVAGNYDLLWQDFPKEAQEILRNLFYRERVIRPLTEEDLKTIEAVVIERELLYASSHDMNDYERSMYKEGLIFKYDPDWEYDYLHNLMGIIDYTSPSAMVYLVNLNENGRSLPWVARYKEETGWEVQWLNEGWAPEPEPVVFTGDTYPAVESAVSTQELAKALKAQYSGEKDTAFELTNAYYCCQDLVRGKCDLLLSGEPTSDFYTDAAYNGVTLQLDRIGSDPFVFFVSTDNPVQSLTVSEIRDIYSGKITNWKEVGGKDAEIVAFQQPTNSVSQIGMKTLVMQDETMIAPVTGFIMTVYGDSAFTDVIMRFDESENAFGYAYGSYANALYLNENVKVLAVEGVLPEAEAVRNGDYPLVGGIYAITRKEDVSENTQKLVKGLLSPSGQKCVLQEGFVPVLDVGEYVPAEQAKSDEPVLSLTDTYATNPVRVMTKTDTYEGVDYQYGVLLGLSDSAVTEKINQLLHDDALACLKKAMEIVPGGSPSTPNCFVLAEFNSGNLLSVRTQIYYYKNPGNAYTSTVGTNVRLDSGERLTLHDLFRDDAGGKDIFNEGFYRDILQKKITGTPKHYSYQNVEDRLLLYTRRYDEGDAFDFYFTPRCACLLGEGRTEASQPLCIWFCECPGATAVYGKFADLEVAYDGSYESCASIPVLTDPDDPLKSTVEKTNGYLLDIALYESFSTPDDEIFTDACWEAMMKAYNEYVQELRERLEKKASEGVYVFCNPTVQIETFGADSNYPYPYRLCFDNLYLEFESREELEAACEYCLKEIRSPYWYEPGGRNYHIAALIYSPEMPEHKGASVDLVFDEQGVLIHKEGQMFKDDAPYESQP